MWPLLREEVIKKVDGVLATRSVYIEGCKLLGLENCAYIGFGIDTDTFAPRPRNEAIKSLYNIRGDIINKVIWGSFDDFCDELLGKEPFVLGFVGAARPSWKNVGLIIKVFNTVTKIFKETSLLIISRDAHFLLPLISKLPKNVGKRVVIFNNMPHVYIPTFYNLIDVFINPSLLDSLEINTLEALVSGNIVLASNRGCINDLKQLGIDSFKTFDPTPISLLNALIPILRDPDSYKKELLKQLDYVRSQLDLRTYGGRIIRAIEKLCCRDNVSKQRRL